MYIYKLFFLLDLNFFRLEQDQFRNNSFTYVRRLIIFKRNF